MTHDFVHLRTHSIFSLADGLMSPERIIDFAVTLEMPAIGLADTLSLAGMPAFLRAAAQRHIKPLPGLQLLAQHAGQTGEVALLALNEDGLRQLIRLHNAVQHGVLTVSELELRDLAMLTGGPAGLLAKLGQQGRHGEDAALQMLAQLQQRAPGRVYVELQRHGDDDRRAEAWTLGVADACGLPVVASTDPVYDHPALREPHSLLRAIAEGRPYHPGSATAQRWLKPPAEMQALFADLPTACAATQDLASRVQLGSSPVQVFMPKPLADAAFAARAASGLERRLIGVADEQRELYRARLATELRLIEMHGTAACFLVAEQTMAAAAQEGALAMTLPVSSPYVTAWALGISEIDPVAAGLSYRHLLEDHLAPMLLTVPSQRQRQVLACLSRQTDSRRPVHATQYRGLNDDEFQVRVKQVTGCDYDALERQYAGKPQPAADHEAWNIWSAASLLKASKPLHWHYPHYGYCALVEEFECEDLPIHAGADGLVMMAVDRMDRVTNNIIMLSPHSAFDELQTLFADRAAFHAVPSDDAEVFCTLRAGATEGVYGCGSEFMRKVLSAEIKPNNLEQMMAAMALFRPGWFPMISDYAQRRAGARNPKPPHPLLKEILASSYGLLLYDEQVVAIYG